MKNFAITDISPETLAKLKENSRDLGFKSLNAGVWSWVPDLGCFCWNEKCYELFDQHEGDLSFDKLILKVYKDDRQHVIDTWEHIFESKEKFEIEFRILILETIRWVRIEGFTVEATDDLPAHASGVMLDITNEKQFSQKLKEANDTKDRFFSIIAHDLRSPFTSILGFSRLLNEEYDDFTDDERKMMIRQILNSTESTFQLLDNLLTWAKTQLGRITFTPEYFEIEPLVLETVNLVLPQAKIKDISVKILEIDRGKVFADVNMIRTVIRNLLSNAIKFSYEGSSISIKAIRKADSIEVFIADTGTGIDSKVIASLFSLNEQIRSTKGTANEKGTGLGLILCKEFIEKNGGRITVKSKLGEGSEFAFTIPRGNKI